MAFLDVIVAGITGLVSGTFASLVAPWVNWRIERVRDRARYRRDQVRRWREAIQGFDFGAHNFADTVVYAELRPYLNEDFCRTLETGRTAFVPAEGRGQNAVRHHVLDAVTEVERKWGLI